MATRTVYVDTVNGSASPTDPTQSNDAYSTLAIAEAGEQTSLSDPLIINCTGSTDDTTQAYFLGWTTSAANYIEIIGEQTTGIWSDSLYTLNVASNFGALRYREEYMRVRNIQVTGTAAGVTKRVFIGQIEAPNDIRFEKSIIKGAGTDASGNYGIEAQDSDTNFTFNGCVIYGFAGAGGIGAYLNGATTDAQSLTVYDCENDGVRRIQGTVDIANSAVFGNGDDFEGIFNSIDYCASDDGDGTNATTITQSASDYAALVTDAPGGDFTIKDASSELYDNGTATGRPSTDIIGNSWTTDDIGAFAYSAESLLPINVTGSATDGVTESEIIAGGETIVLTIVGDTWVATAGDDNAITDAIIAGITSAQSETNGWNNVVRANMVFGDVARTSDTVITITLAAESTYDITSNETITITVPASALTTTATEVVATPTFDVTNEVGGIAIFRRRIENAA